MKKSIIVAISLSLITYFYMSVTDGFEPEIESKLLASTKTKKQASEFKMSKIDKVKQEPMVDPLITANDSGVVKEIVLINKKLNKAYFARMNHSGYKNMHTLNLSGSNFNPIWLMSISKYKGNITTMQLDGTLMTNHSLSYLVNFPNLEDLNLINSSITAEGLLQLPRLKKLKRLNISKRLANTAAFIKVREALPELKLYSETLLESH